MMIKPTKKAQILSKLVLWYSLLKQQIYCLSAVPIIMPLSLFLLKFSVYQIYIPQLIISSLLDKYTNPHSACSCTLELHVSTQKFCVTQRRYIHQLFQFSSLSAKFELHRSTLTTFSFITTFFCGKLIHNKCFKYT